MKREDFIKQAIAAGKDKEEIRKVYASIEASGGFDEQVFEQKQPEPVSRETPEQQQRAEPIWNSQTGEIVPENVGPYYKQGIQNLAKKPYETLFPGAASVEGKGLVPAVKRNALGAFDVMGWPDRAIDYASGGAFERGKKTIGEAVDKIPGEGKISDLVRGNLKTGADIATSPTTYVGAGTIKKLLTKETPETIAQAMAKKSSVPFKPLKNQTGGITIKSASDVIPDIDEMEKSISSYTPEQKIKFKTIKESVGSPPKKGVRNLLISDDEAKLLSQKELSGETPFPEVLRQAYSAKVNRLKGGKEALTPFEIAASDKAIPALNKLDQMRKEVGRIKGDLVRNADEYLISTNQFVDATPAQKRFKEMVRDNFGAIIDGNGKIIDAPGMTIKDSADKAMIRKMYGIVEKLRPESTLGEIDGVISDLRNIVEHSKVSQTRQMNTIAEGIGKAVRNDLKNIRMDYIENSVDWGGAGQFIGQEGAEKLKNSLVNYERYTKLEDRLNRMLGQVTDNSTGVPQKGASAMKAALASNARGENKAVFELVKDITGIDIQRAAAKAEVAMKAVGDSRANDLLKEAGIISSAARGDKIGIAAQIGRKGVEKFTGEKPDQLLRYYYKSQGRTIREASESAGKKINPLKNNRGSIGAAAEEFIGTPAIRDPKTGKIYQGGWRGHKDAIVKGETSEIQERLKHQHFLDNTNKPTSNVGFIDKSGNFISRSEAEKIMERKYSSPSLVSQFHNIGIMAGTAAGAGGALTIGAAAANKNKRK